MTNLRIHFASLAGTMLLSAMGTLQAQTHPGMSDQLYAIIDTAWAFRSIQRPLDTEGEDAFLGPDLSQQALDHRLQFWQKTAARLDSIDAGSLSPEDNMNLRIFRYITDDEIARYVFKAHLRPFNAEGGFHTSFGGRATNLQLRNADSAERYIDRLESFGRQVDQQLQHLRTAIETGYVLPGVILTGFDSTAWQFVSSSVEESIFYQPFRTLPDQLADAEKKRIRQRGRKAIQDVVLPAYRRLAMFLRDEYLPAAPAEVGASAMPHGEAYYAQRIRHFTTLDMTAREVFETGKSEVHR
ncbi:MAG: DUF885 family protein, partial [Saprospiraceae bacterium]|nr:DUF885 family protein [Saprospiraceae bacterium]